MQVFIFGASKTTNKFSVVDTQIFVQKLINGQRPLDFTLHGINQAGIDNNNIFFVGGYQIEKIMKFYPDLHYVLNPKWEDTHVIGSLKYAMESWHGGDVIFLYADTVFRPEVFNQLIKFKESVIVGIDSEWKSRISDTELLLNAEKVLFKKKLLDRFGRKSIPFEKASAQFTGLTYLRKDVAKKLHYLFYNDQHSKLKDKDSLTDLLSLIFQDWNINIKPFDIKNNWAELDTPLDLSKFIFGTKAETLERIKPFTKKSNICDQIHFTIKEWINNQQYLINNIQSKFSNKKLIIRSSSLEEDSWLASQAGAFLSINNINSNDSIQLKKSINKVINAFINKTTGQNNLENQVLIQPFIYNVAVSGVAFTKHLENNTPYYLINYDDVTGTTDSITSGNTLHSKSITIYKKAKSKINDIRIKRIIDALEEIEKITDYDSLDIEFVITNNNKLYILQVRPIAIHTNANNNILFEEFYNETITKVKSRLKKYKHLYGDTSILADMPDWNPAEMIGIRPNPLALSLYQYLITDSTWRISRNKIGYNNPNPEKLLFCIGGHPYIDVRNSFNNLIPDGLSPKLANKLVNHYIKRLKENPHLHDKVEFDILITCYTSDIDIHLQRLKKDGFNEKEISELKEKLKILTLNTVKGKTNSIQSLLFQTEILEKRNKNFLSIDYNINEIPNIIFNLLNDCIELGTIPFSILARYGFIASSLLRGLVSRNIISEKEKNDFLNSIETIAGQMIIDMNMVSSGELTLKSFLVKYGHLRPNSYDINSFSYDEKPNNYFSKKQNIDKSLYKKSYTKKRNKFEFSKSTNRKIQDELEAMGFDISVNELLEFIKNATAAREYAKFQFSKNLDKVLKLIVYWGEYYGFSRNSMSYLFIEDIIKLDKMTITKSHKDYIEIKINEGKNWHKFSNMIETPQFISSISDLEIIMHNESEPNFVTTKSITGEITTLNSSVKKENLKDKIVLIEGADPGFDWIFLYPIKGLITKYGGAASHMTIRCAEFGLPAAIGCGDDLFNKLLKASNIELNCSNKQIKILK